MTEQEYMQEQGRLRAIAYNASLSEQERVSAQASLKALVEQCRKEFPPYSGTFHYTEEQEAKRHGF